MVVSRLVTAVAAIQKIITRKTLEHIIAVETLDRVLFRRPEEVVVACRSDKSAGHIRNADRYGLRRVVHAVIGMNDHAIDVVAIEVGRRFEVRRGLERHCSGDTIDIELRGIIARERV